MNNRSFNPFNPNFIYNSSYYSLREEVEEAYELYYEVKKKEIPQESRRMLRFRRHQSIRRKRAQLRAGLEKKHYILQVGDKEVRVEYFTGEGLELLRKLRSRK